MKNIILLLLLLTGCSNPSIWQPTPAATIAPGQSPEPTPIGKPIDPRLNGTYTLSHAIGETTIVVNGSYKATATFYNRIDRNSFHNALYVTTSNGFITTYDGEYPIEEFGEFFERPYYFEGNDLVVIGMDTNQTTDKLFIFERM